MNAASLAHIGKWQWSPAGAVNIACPSARFPLSDTNIGSPGPGVWYTNRVPSRDQSYSATPSRYGLGCPPSVGTAHIPMSPEFPLPFFRTQNVISEPSGENPIVRTDGFTSSGVLPLVRL